MAICGPGECSHVYYVLKLAGDVHCMCQQWTVWSHVAAVGFCVERHISDVDGCNMYELSDGASQRSRSHHSPMCLSYVGVDLDCGGD
jgi:hypothetical protein